MKVEIWSDVVCPFCYIGKRKLEKALENFPARNQLEIVWRSFQLDPEAKPKQGESVDEYLANRKGVSIAEGKRINDSMTVLASEVGLEYHLDTAIVNNTLDAHRLLHLAKIRGLQNQMKERLFAAYYTESQNIGDIDTLIKLGVEVGLNKNEIRTTLLSDKFTEDVALDIYEAKQIGVNGVPFFVFNNKYAISGAQPSDIFQEVLNKVYEEEKPLIISEGSTGFCTIDGICK